ncbi:MAG: insulinase family protein [Pyrinomonadaceae bacterium]
MLRSGLFQNLIAIAVFASVFAAAATAQSSGPKDLTEKISESRSFAEIEQNVERIQTGGIRYALLHRKNAGSAVFVRIEFRFGSEGSLMDRDVAADFAGQLLMRSGTKDRAKEHLTKRFSELGADVNISGDVFSCWANIKTPAANLAEVLKIVGEILRRPRYEKIEFDELKRETLKVVGNFKSSPQAIAARELGIYLNSEPVGHPNYSGSIDESLAKIGSAAFEEAIGFHRDFYGASDGFISFVGEFEKTEALKAAEEAFGGFKSPQFFDRVRTKYSKKPGIDKTIDVPADGPAHFVARLNLPVSEDHADYPALFLGTYILGNPGFADSRFSKRASSGRENIKLMSIFYANPLDDFGGFIVFGDFPPEDLEKTEAIFEDELGNFLDHGPNEEEISAAKNHWLITRENLRTDNKRLAGHLNSGLYLKRTLEWDDKLQHKIASLTPSEIKAAIKKHIIPNDIAIIKAGNFSGSGAKVKK